MRLPMVPMILLVLSLAIGAFGAGAAAAGESAPDSEGASDTLIESEVEMLAFSTGIDTVVAHGTLEPPAAPIQLSGYTPMAVESGTLTAHHVTTLPETAPPTETIGLWTGRPACRAGPTAVS